MGEDEGQFYYTQEINNILTDLVVADREDVVVPEAVVVDVVLREDSDDFAARQYDSCNSRTDSITKSINTFVEY